MAFVILFFFLQSIPNLIHLSLGWTALIGVIILLIVSEQKDLDMCLHQVEWSTLLFFAALFILMECLTELGLIVWMGRQVEYIIGSVPIGSRLAVAILIILWVFFFYLLI